MDKHIITCEMAKDLIPLYSEGLCSEESRKAVENHLSECESCRRLLETPVEQEQVASVPEEKNVFKKLNRKMKRSKLWIIALSVVLALLVGAVGFLTVGQIVKGEGMVSFETIAQSLEARKVVGYIVNKDFTSYVNSIFDNKYFFRAENATSEKINAKSAEELLQAYEASFGSEKVKNIDIGSSYSLLPEPNAVMILTNCKIEYTDGSVLELEMVKNYDNRFLTSALGFSGDDSVAAKDFVSCFNLFSSKSGTNDFVNKTVLERIFTRHGSADNSDKSITEHFITERFAPEYAQEVGKSAAEFLAKGYETECAFSDDRYDDDINRYFDMYLTAADEQGTALLCARIYRRYDGLLKPETVTVYRNGCTDELAQGLEHFFG